MLAQIILEENQTYGSPHFVVLWKKLINEMFEEFILFFAPELHEEIDFTISHEFLQQELLQAIITDSQHRKIAAQLVKVPLINGTEKWILIHIEGQGKADTDFRKRMFYYFYRIYDRYNHEVYAIALLTNSRPHRKQDYFDYHYYGTSLIYKYNVFNFLEQDIDGLMKSSNPFAVAVLAGIYAIKAKNNDRKRYTFKRSLMIHVLRRFPSQKANSRDYQSALFSFIDYVLQTPDILQQKLREEITEYINQEVYEKKMGQKEISQSWKSTLEDLDKLWAERAKKND